MITVTMVTTPTHRFVAMVTVAMHLVCLSAAPPTEFHYTSLVIEREKLDINPTAALIDRWRHPEHLAEVVDDDVAVEGNLVVAVGTAGIKEGLELGLGRDLS